MSTEANKAVVRSFIEAWNTKDFERFDSLMAEDAEPLMPFTGTHLGPVLDLAPTGKKIRVSEMVFFRIKSGKIVEAWEDWDEHGMRAQLAGE